MQPALDPRPVLTLRPIGAADMDFLCEVYASTREAELAQVPWTDEMKAAFCRMQFEAQHAHYQRYYQDTDYDLILADGQPVGRLYVARWADEIRIVDITLLPAQRNRGIGTRLVSQLLAEAAAAGKSVSIHVEMLSPAVALYERLGFERRHDDGALYCFMEAAPTRPRSARPPSPAVRGKDGASSLPVGSGSGEGGERTNRPAGESAAMTPPQTPSPPRGGGWPRLGEAGWGPPPRNSTSSRFTVSGASAMTQWLTPAMCATRQAGTHSGSGAASSGSR